jgi:hypothetical protein
MGWHRHGWEEHYAADLSLDIASHPDQQTTAETEMLGGDRKSISLVRC